MSLFCIKCSKLTYNNNVGVKHKIDGKISPYSYCIDIDKFKSTNKEQLRDLIKSLSYLWNNDILLFEVYEI